MPSCSGRNVLYFLMALQLISTLERQVFDFMGYMWLPIITNFVHTLMVILGIFGVYQYTSKHMLAYLVWNLIWIGWSVFLVCFYLEAGNLVRTDDILSFGTGSYSWWLVNGFGCTPEYFPANETSLDKFIPETIPNVYRPPKPSKVTGCILEYQYVEVTHACIQIILAIFALLFGITLTHYLLTVVEPKYRKSKLNQSLSNGNGHGPLHHGNGNSTMYSITVNDSNHQLTQETDFYNSLESGVVANGDVRPQMTPRRVKRRSYTRSSARSAGKQLKKDLAARSSGRSTRSAGGVVSKGGSGKAVNPVTRLMQETEPHHTTLVNDSSTSNEDGRHGGERYGQVNPGYVSSRPNSLYSHANNQHGGNGPTSITDYEASRPPSALTSYSNFHGQRRPLPGQVQGKQPGSLMSNHLTQESLVHFDNNPHGGQVNLGGPASHHNPGHNLNNSFDDDLPPPPPPLSSSPTMNHHREDTDNNSSITTDTTAQMPVPQQRSMPNKRNEYVNMPVTSALPNGGGDVPPLPPHNYANMPINKNPLPPPRIESNVNPNPNPGAATASALAKEAAAAAVGGARPRQPLYNGFHQNHRYNHDGSSADESNRQQEMSYNDTQTLRADMRLDYQPPKAMMPEPSYNNVNGNHGSLGDDQSSPPSFDFQQQQAPITPHREITIDYDANNVSGSGGTKMSNSNNGSKAEPQQATRIPSGHMRRDRNSLRAKQRKEMEEARLQKQKQQRQQPQAPDEDDYGFATGGAGRALPNGGNNLNQNQQQDKWYLHDAMRPIGAPQHGGNCKCYRCQRKLTAI